MNDARKFEQEYRARLASGILRRVPEGLCLIAGPADAATWHIHDPKWNEKAQLHMDILKECSHPVINCKTPFSAMTLTSVVTKKGEEWFDYHYMDNPHNCVSMVALITCLGCFCQFTGNLVDLHAKFNLLHVRVPVRHCFGRGVYALGAEQLTAADMEEAIRISNVGGDPEQNAGGDPERHHAKGMWYNMFSKL